MPPRPLATLPALALAALAGCGPSLPAGNASCGPERTELDGVCVSQTVADYVSCVRAQGARLGSDRSRRLSAEAGHLGVRVGGTAELRDTLEKQYSVSSASELEIIHECGRLAGTRSATGTAPPPATGTASALPPSTGQPTPPAARLPAAPPTAAPPPPSPSTPPAPVNLARGLLCHWPLDEGQGTTAGDRAGNHDLTLAPGHWGPGRLDRAVRVGGGTQMLTTAPSYGPHAPRELTLALWVYQDAPGLGVLVFKGTQPDHDDSRNREFSLHVQESGRLVIGFVTQAVAGKHGIYLTTDAPVLAPERWTHVAGVISRESGLTLLYVDGREVARSAPVDPGGSSIHHMAAPLWLGNGFSGTSGFEGVLDDVRVYGRALAPAELGALARGEP